MRKAFLFFIFCSFFIHLGFESKTISPFEKAEEIYLKAFTIGDFSELPIADSIFGTYCKEKEFANATKQYLKALVYSLHIHAFKRDYSQNLELQNQDLDLIEKTLSENSKLKSEHLDLYVQLMFLKQQIFMIQGQENAHIGLEELAKTYQNNPSVAKNTMGLLYESLGKWYYRQKNFSTSAYYCKLALESYENRWKHRKYALMQYLGGGYYNYDKIDSSLYYMKEAYEGYKSIENNTSQASLRRGELAFNIGMIYQGKTGDYHESESYLLEAIEWETDANGEASPTLITYNALLADTYFTIRDIQKAEFYALKAYSLANEVIKTESVYLKSLASMSLSRIYTQRGHYDLARELMQKVLVESLDFYGKDDKFTTQVYLDFAVIEEMAGKLEEAEYYCLLAVESAQASGRIYSISSAYDRITKIHVKNKNFEKALHYALLDYELINQHLDDDFKIKAISCLELSEIYLGLNQLPEAIQFLEKTEEILKGKTNTHLMELDILAIKNAILLKNYETSGSIDNLQKAHSNIDQLIELIIKGKSEYKYQDSKLFYSQSVSKHIEGSLELAAELHRVSPSAEVYNTLFKLMEINKSTILIDGMLDSEIKTQTGVPQSVLEEEKEIAKKLGELNRKISRAEMDSLFDQNELKVLLDDRINMNAKMEEIQDYLKKNHTSYYESKNLILSENIQYYQTHALNENQGFLEYFVGENSMYRLFVTKNHIDFVSLPNFEEIEKQTDLVINHLVERKPIEQSVASIAKHLLPEIPDNIEDLVIIADKNLAQLPFEILPYGESNLLERFNLSYAGSVQLFTLQNQMESKRRTSVNWLGFAPDFVKQPLPNNKLEVHKIKDLIKGKEITGKVATKTSFLQEAPKASILHLATHSEIDPLNPMLSRMYFYADDETEGELTASEIYNMNLNADMIVLSACNTGIGMNESGDGVMSLSRAFTYAGISSTVMSLWKVSDKETSELMVMFYENLKQGQTKNEALRNAKLSYLKTVNEPELLHPYYWAGFVVTGNVAPMKEDSISWWYVTAILGLLSGGFFLWKSKADRVVA